MTKAFTDLKSSVDDLKEAIINNQNSYIKYQISSLTKSFRRMIAEAINEKNTPDANEIATMNSLIEIVEKLTPNEVADPSIIQAMLESNFAISSDSTVEKTSTKLEELRSKISKALNNHFLKNKLITDTVSAVQILESDLKNFKPSPIPPSFTKNANVLISSIDSISKTPEEFKKLSPSVFYYLYGMISNILSSNAKPTQDAEVNFMLAQLKEKITLVSEKLYTLGLANKALKSFNTFSLISTTDISDLFKKWNPLEHIYNSDIEKFASQIEQRIPQIFSADKLDSVKALQSQIQFIYTTVISKMKNGLAPATEKDIASYNKKISDLNGEVKKLGDEKSQLIKDNNQLNLDLNDALQAAGVKDINIELQDKINAQEKVIAQANSDYQAKVIELEQVKTAAEEAARSANTLSVAHLEQISKLTEEFEASKSQLEVKTQSLKKSEKELNDANIAAIAANKLTADQKKQIDDLTLQIAGKRDELAAKETALQEKDQQILELTTAKEEAVALKDSEIAKDAAKINELAASLKSSQETVATKDGLIEAMKTNIASLTSQIEARKSDIEALTEKKNNLTLELEQVKTTNLANEMLIAQLITQITAFTLEDKQNKQIISRLEAQVRTNEELLTELRTTNATNSSELAALNLRFEELNTKNSELKSTNSTLTSANSTLTSANSELQLALEAKSAELNTISTALADARAQCLTGLTGLTGLTECITKLKENSSTTATKDQEISDLKANINLLRIQISELESSFDDSNPVRISPDGSVCPVLTRASCFSGPREPPRKERRLSTNDINNLESDSTSIFYEKSNLNNP